MKALVYLSIFIVLVSPLYAESEGSPTTLAAKSMWTMDEIFYRRKKDLPPKKPIEYCQAGRFIPCVCEADAAKGLDYVPALQECGGKAAILSSGKFNGSYSAVVRDSENRDRWPPAGFNGCTQTQADQGLSMCSAFKAQETLFFENQEETQHYKVECLGASGFSDLFKDVVRITVKLKDIPDSDDDPLYRVCIRPNKPLNVKLKKPTSSP